MRILLYSKLRGAILKQQIMFSPEDKILVVPVCTMERYVSNQEEWNAYFSPEGILSQKILAELGQVGAVSHNINFYNYISKDAVRFSDYSCVILPGGDAPVGIQRLIAAGLDEQLKTYAGIIIGYSAGALLLFKRYFLSPNYYYKTFSICDGLGIISHKILIEVHFDRTSAMRDNIHYAIQQMGEPVIAIGNEGGIEFHPITGSVDAVGDVEFYCLPRTLALDKRADSAV